MRAPRTSETLEALVGFDTTSRNSNLPLVEWVEAYLDRFGVVHERITMRAAAKPMFGRTIGPAGVPGTISRGTRTWFRSTDSHGRATRSG
jgi:acetylornithine deacetylase